jgi:pimeloyl-ACP methyl ester carboxylesterase
MPEAQTRDVPAFPGGDYGNPDPRPEWLRIDWREHLRRIELPVGGFVATEAVIDEPRRFDRLVLVSAAGISFAESRGRRTEALARTMAAAAPHLLSGDRRLYLTRPGGRQLAFGRVMRTPAKLRPELLKEQVRPGLSAPGFADAMIAIAGYDTRERLTEIEIPTLVVWGLNDRIVPVEAALGYQRLIPRSRLEIFERTGHVPMLERPRRFNTVLEEFVASDAAALRISASSVARVQ